MQEEQYIYINENGNKFYYKDKAMTILHRLDGPAYEGASGYKSWYVDGKLHRLDGPAVEGTDGHKEWWVDGKWHRLDGPAVEWADGSKYWCVDDEYFTEEEFIALTAPTLELTLEEIAAKFGVDVSKVKIKK